MDRDKLKGILKILVVVFIIGLIIYVYVSNENKRKVIPYSKWTEREKVEYLEEENEKYQDKISHLESQLEELQQKCENSKDLISALKEQLESYGIEPYEL